MVLELEIEKHLTDVVFQSFILKVYSIRFITVSMIFCSSSDKQIKTTRILSDKCGC